MTKMNKELEGFLHDLVILIQEKYNESLKGNDQELESDKEFRLGSNFAYYDVLELIESQLTAFGYNSNLIEEITPVFNKKAKRK